MMVAAAVSPPQFTSSNETKLYTAMGKVIMSLPPRISTKMKLFHDAMKLRIVAATMPGRLSGRTIRTKVPTREHPSIRAASSSSRGMSSKKPAMIQMISGRTMMMWVRTMPLRVLMARAGGR